MKTGYAWIVIIAIIVISSIVYYQNQIIKINNSAIAKENIKKINSNQSYFYRMVISYKNGITDEDAINAIFSILEKNLDAKIKKGWHIDLDDIFNSPNDIESLKAISSKFGIQIQTIFSIVYDYELLMKGNNERVIQ